ncbi:MAG: metallo-mystery pair system four-Cys motif protein [Woeseiaceae bacterium]|nr:metallo-mystery pair system four-Cys motif protein [Woeseiaceae bacterium]
MKRSLLLILFTLSACESNQQQVSIAFNVEFNGQPIRCDSESPVALTDLRFFIHDLELTGADGTVVPTRLKRDSAWQNGAVAFIDLENGQGGCDDGTPESNARVIASVSSDSDLAGLQGLRFTLGVPFELNHSNLLEAAPPLDDAAMHWHWRSGYKFLRAGVETDNDSFWFHLGSTACQGTTGNISGCDSPNRPIVELAGFNPQTDSVVIDIGRLFDAVDLEDGERSDCSSGPTEQSCPPVLATLGLGPEASTIADGVFAARPRQATVSQ